MFFATKVMSLHVSGISVVAKFFATTYDAAIITSVFATMIIDVVKSFAINIAAITSVVETSIIVSLFDIEYNDHSC